MESSREIPAVPAWHEALRGLEQRAKEREWAANLLCGCDFGSPRPCRLAYTAQDALCACLGLPAFSSTISTPPPEDMKDTTFLQWVKAFQAMGPPPLVYGLVCVDISQPDTSMSIGNRFFADVLELLSDGWLDGIDLLTCSKACRLARHVVSTSRVIERLLDKAMNRVVLRGVRNQQKSTEFLLPKEEFARIVASVSVRVCPSLLLSCFALRALHHYVEAELIHLSKEAAWLASFRTSSLDVAAFVSRHDLWVAHLLMKGRPLPVPTLPFSADNEDVPAEVMAGLQRLARRAGVLRYEVTGVSHALLREARRMIEGVISTLNEHGALHGGEDRGEEKEDEKGPCSAVAAVMAHVLSVSSLRQQVPMQQLISQSLPMPLLATFLANAWRYSSERHHCRLEPPAMEELATLMMPVLEAVAVEWVRKLEILRLVRPSEDERRKGLLAAEVEESRCFLRSASAWPLAGLANVYEYQMSCPVRHFDVRSWEWIAALSKWVLVLLTRVRGPDVLDGEEAGALLLLTLEINNVAAFLVDTCVTLWPYFVEQGLEDGMSVESSVDDEDSDEDDDEDEETQDDEMEWWEGISIATSFCEKDQEEEEEEQKRTLRDRDGFRGRYVGVREMNAALRTWGKKDGAMSGGVVYGPGSDA